MKIIVNEGLGRLTLECSAHFSILSGNDEATKKEMAAKMRHFFIVFGLVFAAPEPVRRSFVEILNRNLGQTSVDLNEAIEQVAKVYH